MNIKKEKIRNKWDVYNFPDAIQNVPVAYQKLKREYYQIRGKYPIIDQGADLVTGYTDNASLLYNGPLPVIVFGDHTLIVKFVDYPFAVGADGAKIILPNLSRFAPKFLYYAIIAKKLSSEGYKRHYSKLREQSFVCPPLSTQNVITTILDRACNIKEKHAKTITVLNQTLQSIFIRMFGHPETFSSRWERQQLVKIADIRGGIPLSKERAPQLNPTPYLTVRNIYAGILNLSDVRYMEVSDVEFSKWALKAGDLLMLEANADRNQVGRTAMFNGEIVNCVHQNHLFRIRVNTTNILPKFLMVYLNNPDVRARFFPFAKTTSGLNSISKTQLNSLSIFCPPINLQSKFVNIIEVVEKIKQKQQYLEKVIEVFINSLMDKLFNNEIQLSDVDISDIYEKAQDEKAQSRLVQSSQTIFTFPDCIHKP